MSYEYDAFLDAHKPFANLNKHPYASQAYLECVIVEPRIHPRLVSVISNISAHFPYAAITVLHSKRNPLPIEILNANNIKKWQICDENLTRAEYSELISSPRLWDDILEAPYVLIFQTDTGVCENRILRFLEYDYIGAPWAWTVAGSNHIKVGNGGFSLRNRKMMSAIANRYRVDPNWKDPVTYEIGEAEDIFFARHLVNWETAILPPVEIASSFSVEHNYHHNPMGFHRAYEYHTLEIVKTWFQKIHDYVLHFKPSTQSELLAITDAWIQSETGSVYTTPIFKQWLSLGISGVDNHLRIPKDTKIPLSIANIPVTEYGVKKYLCFITNKSEKVNVILLYQLRIKDDFVL